MSLRLLGSRVKGILVRQSVSSTVNAQLVSPLRRDLCTRIRLRREFWQHEAMVDHVSELSNSALFLMARTDTSRKVHQAAAARERMRREIMTVDGVDHSKAIEMLLQINEKNSENMTLYKLPYTFGIVVARIAGVLSLPLVFYLPVAMKFNELVVHEALPEEGSVETMLEVGSWTWAWMEPPLGTISFFLLCMGFARELQVESGSHPSLSDQFKRHLADRLEAAYPQYASDKIRDYAIATALKCDRKNIMSDDQYIRSRLRRSGPSSLGCP